VTESIGTCLSSKFTCVVYAQRGPLLPVILHREPGVDPSLYAWPSVDDLCSTGDKYSHVPSPATAFPALGFLLFPLAATVLPRNLAVPRAWDFRCWLRKLSVSQFNSKYNIHTAISHTSAHLCRLYYLWRPTL